MREIKTLASQSAALLLLTTALIVTACSSSSSERAPEFELTEVGPVSEARAQPLDQYARLVFNRAIDVTHVSEADFGFFNITLLEDSEESVTKIPFRLEIGANPSVVFLRPIEDLPKNATLFVGVMEGFKARNGDALAQTQGFRFYTIRDDKEPTLSAVYPPNRSDSLGVHDSFELNYTETLFGYEAEFLSDRILHEKLPNTAGWGAGSAERVETRVTVEGSTVTVTPTRALNYNHEYSLTSSFFDFEDEYGNTPGYDYNALFYKTADYPEIIDLPYKLDYHLFDATTNSIVGLNKEHAQFIKISLRDGVAVTTHSLPEAPSAYCHHKDSNRLFAAFENSNLIRTYDIETLEERSSIAWTPREPTDDNQDKELGFGAFYISCATEALFVTNYRNNDKPWGVSRIDIEPPHTQVVMQDSRDTGDIIQLESGDYLATTLDRSQKKAPIRLLQEQEDAFVELNSWQVSFNGVVKRYRYPEKFEINFDTRHVIFSNMIYALDNMPGRLKRFDSFETILAFDPVRGRLYTHKGVYNFEGFELLRSRIIPEAELAEFDNQGNLILINNDEQKLYRIDERAISSGEFP